MRRHAGQVTSDEWNAEAIDDWPSNRLKELRITVRRLRFDMRLFAPYFKPRALRDLRDGAQEFAAVLGAPREYDMLIDRARAFARANADAEVASSIGDLLGELIGEWKSQRRVARETLADYLRTESHRRWRASLFEFIEEESDRGRRAPKVGMPSAVRHVSHTLLWQHLSAVYAFDVLPDAPRPEDLHELRIAVKRLRYFVDSWQDVLDGASSAHLLAACAALQSGLGAINDAHMAALHAVQFVAQRRDLRKSEAREVLRFAGTEQQFVDNQSTTWRTLLAPLTSFSADTQAGRFLTAQ